MDKINNIGLSRLLTSVYDFDGFTEQEVWCRIAQKINIIIEHFNYLDKKIENEKENNKAKFEYLLGEGLTETVAKIILEKIADGTLGKLINDTLLEDINNKVDEEIGKVNEQLDTIETEKANKNDVRYKNILIGEDDITEQLRQSISGNAPIIQGVADKIISIEKTNFINPNKNLFNSLNTIDGYMIDGSYDAELQVNSNSSSSNFIYVEPNTTYIGNDSYNYAEYDNDKNYVKGKNNLQNDDFTFTTSSTTKYIRLSCIKDRKMYFQLEKGNKTTSLEEYKNVLDKNIEVNISSKNCDFIVQPKNLFNKNSLVFGKDIDTSWDTLYDNVGQCVTDYYVNIKQNTHLVCNVMCNYGFRDKEGNPSIVGFQNVEPNTPIIVPEGAVKVRFAINKNKINECQVEIGDETSKYSEYFEHEYIKDEFIRPNIMKKWIGKNGDSLGDSLTGQGFFQTHVKELLQLNKFENHGIGGSKLSGNNVDESRPSMWQDVRINALSDDADFITVLGGQNDGDVEIGEISKSNMNTNTYIGALNVIIDKIYKKYNGEIDIILCTPFYVPSEGDESGERQHKMRNAILELASIQSLPVADLGGLCNANKYTKNIYWGDDKTHPLERFYKEKVTPILIDVLNKII